MTVTEKSIQAQTISISELLPGYLLFNNGKSFLAKRIKDVQAWKYGKKGFYFLTHVGFLDQYIDLRWFVYEQDSPGRFQSSPFDEEYLKDKEDVYIGIPKVDLSEGLAGLRKDAENLAGEDVLLNYSYKSFAGFIVNSLWYKLFKKEIWVTGIPKGTTCSQIIARMFQKWFRMFMRKKFWMWFPCELAEDEQVEIRKLIY